MVELPVCLELLLCVQEVPAGSIPVGVQKCSVLTQYHEIRVENYNVLISHNLAKICLAGLGPQWTVAPRTKKGKIEFQDDLFHEFSYMCVNNAV